MKHRNRSKPTSTLEARLAELSKRLREEAKRLPPCAEREALMRKVRQTESGLQMAEWLRTSVEASS